VTTDATLYHPWTTYIWAREEARRCGDRRVGTDHLLLGLLHDPAAVALLGVSLEQCRQALDSLDRDALGSPGLTASLEAPPIAMRHMPARPTLRAVLKDRLPMTPAAKQALERAARPMRQGRRVNPEDLLLGLLDLKHPDPVADLIVKLDIDAEAVRARISAA
jgi:Clp amino terminal domain, pathogenicity island component